MENDTALDRHLANLLGHGETLPEFWGWFIEAQWSIELEGSDRDVALVARIENRIGGYTSGIYSVDELMTDLREDATEFGVELRESSAA